MSTSQPGCDRLEFAGPQVLYVAKLLIEEFTTKITRSTTLLPIDRIAADRRGAGGTVRVPCESLRRPAGGQPLTPGSGP
ncbi:hypothetical protein [Amycolatopsis sp. lyj-108]|uniref:hypothetical protein n=1 Tax=Amycolatopsis sp. lyj-108 TaxID=2789286 RepID=UPI003979A645